MTAITKTIPIEIHTGAERLEPQYDEHRLANGLRVILHEDHSTPMVTINVLYHVGSKNEQRGKTGFAHLFEHLMFDGSKNVGRGGYDTHCTSVGGDNNAFTSADVTDYYISLPSNQLALGLWLESDRMAEFGIEPISLETQKSVVTEEKRQTVDDVPYGDMTILMHEISFPPSHPYSWETIGSMEDIAGATMEDVSSFYHRFYVPSNAVLVIAGDIDREETMQLVEGYFGSIPPGAPIDRPVADPSAMRTGVRRRVESSIIPFNATFLGYPAPSLLDDDLYPIELLVSILSEGESSRLYQSLEYELEIASETEAFIEDGELGSIFYLYAIAQDRATTTEELERALRDEVAKIIAGGVSERELEKVKNQKVTRIARELQSVSNRAERLAYCAAVFDDPMLAFNEASHYESITVDDIMRVARKYLSVEPNAIEYVIAKGM